jgi:UDP-glucuronate 4-epimerase
VADIVKLLVTGAAGFIGFHTARALLERGDEVVGLDNLNAYYDPGLKAARLEILAPYPNFRFVKLDIADRTGLQQVFEREGFRRVVHLAAQAGVRFSIQNPHAYAESNLIGFLNVLEGCRHQGVEHLVYASTSSVYGANTRLPFSERQNVDHPLTLYFTVYGPWGRPDMALFLFTENILAGKPIEVFNQGHHRRDFTYIDDIVKGVVGSLDRVAAPDPAWDSAAPVPGSSYAPYRIYNIGNRRPVSLMRYIEILEQCLGRKAQKKLLPMQPGDVADTSADVAALERDVGYRPSTDVEEGVKRFVEWYLDYYHPRIAPRT